MKRAGCDGSVRYTTRTSRFSKNRSLCSDFNAYHVLSSSRQMPLARERRKADEDSKMTVVPFEAGKSTSDSVLAHVVDQLQGASTATKSRCSPKYHMVSLSETQLITLALQ